MSEEELSEVRGDIKVIHSKLDSLTAAVANLTQGLGSRVQEHDKDIAVIQADAKNNKEYLVAVSGKVNDHIKNHWQWVGIMIGILTIGAALMKAFGGK